MTPVTDCTTHMPEYDSVNKNAIYCSHCNYHVQAAVATFLRYCCSEVEFFIRKRKQAVLLVIVCNRLSRKKEQEGHEIPKIIMILPVSTLPTNTIKTLFLIPDDI
jgi:hypothetical protein